MNKGIFLASLLSISIYTAQAQFKMTQDINEIPLETKVGSDMVGSVYLYDKFFKGHVLEESNTYYNNMDIRYNIQQDQITSRNKYGVEFAFKTAIKEFQISGSLDDNPREISTIRNGFPAVNEFTNKSYYQILNEGNTLALKKN